MKIKDRVLIVEDDAHISGFISTILTANDYDVITARTGSEAKIGRASCRERV